MLNSGDKEHEVATSWESSMAESLRHSHDEDKVYLINNESSSIKNGNQVVGKQGSWQASASITKAVVGAGSFALPWAFLQAGLFGGMIGIVVLAILSCFTIRMIIQCKNALPNLRGRYVSYVDIAKEVYGWGMGWLLYASIVITSLGACAAYLVFCGNMLESVSRGALLTWHWVLILAVPLTLFTWIRSFRYLSFTSIIGDIALLLAMITMFIEGFREESIANPFDGTYPPIQYLSYPKFFGTAAFLFCVHMLMVPIEQSMHKPQSFQPTLYWTFLGVTLLNLVFASIGYMLYKGGTDDIIINNLPDTPFVDVARVALVFDLFFTFVVVIVPARDIIEGSLVSTWDDSNMHSGITITLKRSWWLPSWETLQRYAIRTLMVVVCVSIAVSVKKFSDLIGLVSGLALSFMAFILPPMLHMRIFWDKLDWVMTIVDVVIALFGVVAAVTTTTVAVISIINSWHL